MVKPIAKKTSEMSAGNYTIINQYIFFINAISLLIK